jgi:hypothetical protein
MFSGTLTAAITAVTSIEQPAAFGNHWVACG